MDGLTIQVVVIGVIYVAVYLLLSLINLLLSGLGDIW